MIYVVCGEDIVGARQLYRDTIEKFRSKQFRITEIALSAIPDLIKQDASPLDLFGTQSVYTISSLSSGYKGRTMTPLKSAIIDLAKHESLILLDWEGSKGAYELSALKKIAHEWHEKKLPTSVFQLLDALYPGNVKQFVTLLQTVAQTQEEMFIYTLVWKLVRNLILIQGGSNLGSKIAPWQRAKLLNQAKRWKPERLIALYEGLMKIDIGVKTSSSVFSVRESIELVCCYFL